MLAATTSDHEDSATGSVAHEKDARSTVPLVWGGARMLDSALVPENPRPPPVVRIQRPWGSEKEFIDGDLAYLGRTAIVLPGAAPREPGELIRFEITIATGAPVFRGEGHVIAHHPAGGTRPAGLEVRFTRIDARSKLMLDRVRERRTALVRSGSIPPPALVSQIPPGMSLTPPPVFVTSSMSTAQLSINRADVEAAVRRGRAHGPISPPPNREEILDRLRERAKRLAASGGFTFKKS
jgi:hypothetical protein